MWLTSVCSLFDILLVIGNNELEQHNTVHSVGWFDHEYGSSRSIHFGFSKLLVMLPQARGEKGEYHVNSSPFIEGKYFKYWLTNVFFDIAWFIFEKYLTS